MSTDRPRTQRSAGATGYETLYGRSLPANRSGALYRAFPYPAKIAPEAIALFVAAHTDPGATVFDGFAGSGTTGLAALLCAAPPNGLRQAGMREGLRANWGPRRAILYELGALGAFIAETLTNPPSAARFIKTGQEILHAAKEQIGWMYAAQDDSGHDGSIRHVVWSERVRCPRCQEVSSFWDGCVSRSPARIDRRWQCPRCTTTVGTNVADRLVEIATDDLLGVTLESRVRRPAWLYGKTGTTTWGRPVNGDDIALLDEVTRMAFPSCTPLVEIPWGDLHRNGYHRGMTHLHHLYTRRNLMAMAVLWQLTTPLPHAVRDALRFWLLSYNASHATLMTRIVAKANQSELVVTSAQPGVLYVSGLPVEKNLLAGLGRKLPIVAEAFAAIHGRSGHVEVRQQSSCHVDLPDQSVDYVFTDPPFGANIPYAEINFINEAWLGRYTQRTDEAIISPSQNKGLSDYQRLLTDSLTEMHRVLKPEGAATLVFHSSSARVWRALQQAQTDAGFDVAGTGVLGKTQGSFKQVTANTVRGDATILLRKCAEGCPANLQPAPDPWRIAEQLYNEAPPAERSAQLLYSRLVSHFLAHHEQVSVSAASFYEWHAARTEARCQ